MICGVGFSLIASKNTVDMGDNYYKYKLAFVFGTFMAIFFILGFSKMISESKVLFQVSTHLCFLSVNSMDILIWHFLAFRLTILIQILVSHAELGAIIAFPIYDGAGIWWLVYLISGIYGSILWGKILEFLTNLIKRRKEV